MDPKEQIVVSNCLWFDSGSVFSSDMMLLKYEHLGAAPALPHIVEVFHFSNKPSPSSPFQESQNGTILPNKKTLDQR